jgi:hypothetical protein
MLVLLQQQQEQHEMEICNMRYMTQIYSFSVKLKSATRAWWSDNFLFTWVN